MYVVCVKLEALCKWSIENILLLYYHHHSSDLLFETFLIGFPVSSVDITNEYH